MKKTPNLPVSENFYTEIRHRIAVSLAPHVLPGETLIYDAIAILDAYLFEGKEPDSTTHFALRLTFSLLRPEIDKAMARSAAARRRRREKNVPESAAVSQEKDADAEAFPPMNRRERRFAEQEERRVARRKARRLVARQKNEGGSVTATPLPRLQNQRQNYCYIAP